MSVQALAGQRGQGTATMSDSPPGRLLVTMATYNERENVPPLIAAVHEQAPHADILVIDDNSPDGTGHWCDNRAATEPRLRCLHRAGKLGLGTATIAGMRYALEHGYRFVLNMDADFSHHPRYLAAILAGMDREDGTPRVDVMIGSRYVRGGAIEGWPMRRHLMSRGVNAYARVLLGLPAKDCSGAFAATARRSCRKSTSTPFARAAIRFKKRYSGI